MGIFILLFTILTIIFLKLFIIVLNSGDSDKTKITISTIMFIIFIICIIGIMNIVIYNTNFTTKIINDYKSNKIKEIIIIENQDTTYKYKY